MHIVFERSELLEGLAQLTGVTGRGTLPILSNVLVEANDDGSAEPSILLTGTDLEVGIQVSLDGVIHQPGDITIPHSRFFDIVKALPDADITLTTTATDRVEIICGDGTYKIIGLASDEYPQLPEVESETSFSIGGIVLQDVIQQTQYAASTEEVRYFLQGVFFNPMEDKTEVVATDGKRLALATCEPINAPTDDGGFIVPLKTVHQIAKTFAEASEVQVSINENQMLVTGGNTLMTTRLVQGDYPNYAAIIPDAMEDKTVVVRAELLGAVRRVSLLANPRNFSVELDITTDTIHVHAEAAEIGEAHEPVAVSQSGLVSSAESVRLGLDARLLMDVLTHIDSPSVEIEVAGPMKAVVFRPHEDQGSLHLIMPLRISEVPDADEA